MMIQFLLNVALLNYIFQAMIIKYIKLFISPAVWEIRYITLVAAYLLNSFRVATKWKYFVRAKPSYLSLEHCP